MVQSVSLRCRGCADNCYPSLAVRRVESAGGPRPPKALNMHRAWRLAASDAGSCGGHGKHRVLRSRQRAATETELSPCPGPLQARQASTHKQQLTKHASLVLLVQQLQIHEKGVPCLLRGR